MFSGHLLCVRCRGGWCSHQTFSFHLSDVPGTPVGWTHCTAGEEEGGAERVSTSPEVAPAGKWQSQNGSQACQSVSSVRISVCVEAFCQFDLLECCRCVAHSDYL